MNKTKTVSAERARCLREIHRRFDKLNEEVAKIGISRADVLTYAKMLHPDVVRQIRLLGQQDMLEWAMDLVQP